MYKSLALINGSLVAVMILSNGILVEAIGNSHSIIVIHLLGLSIALLLFIFSKGHWHKIKGIPIFYLLAGVTGLFTVAFSNIAFLSLGATVTLMLSMFGRILTSSVIDHFGLMGMKQYPFEAKKFFGLGLMLIGVICILIF